MISFLSLPKFQVKARSKLNWKGKWGDQQHNPEGCWEKEQGRGNSTKVSQNDASMRTSTWRAPPCTSRNQAPPPQVQPNSVLSITQILWWRILVDIVPCLGSQEPVASMRIPSFLCLVRGSGHWDGHRLWNVGVGRNLPSSAPSFYLGRNWRSEWTPLSKGHKVYLWQRKNASPLFYSYSVALMMTHPASCSWLTHSPSILPTVCVWRAANCMAEESGNLKYAAE